MVVNARLKTLTILTILSFLSFTMEAYPAGLQSYEQGQPSVGTASVGQAALADDASTVYFNPAGMTRLERPEVLMGGGLLIVSSEFEFDGRNTRRGSDGGDSGSIFPSGGLYYAQKIFPELSIGLAINAPVGLGLDYDDDWKGRYLVQENFMAVVNINPALAYQVTDWLSVGGGVAVDYAFMRQDMAIFNPVRPDGQIKMEFDDWAVGYNLGMLIEPWEATRIGVAYRSQIDFELEGDIEVSGLGALWTRAGLENTYGKTDLTIPRTITVSLYQEVFDKLALLFDVGWANWDKMEKTEIATSSGATVAINRNWRDTWRIGGGLHYRVVDPLLVKAGFSYDSDPVASEEDRLPDMPVDRQWRYAAGLEYDMNENIRLCLNYEFIDLGKAPIYSQIVPRGRILSGDYDQYVNVVSFSFIWKFGK